MDRADGLQRLVGDISKGIFERPSPGLIVDVEEYRHPNAPDVRLVVVGVTPGTDVYSVGGRVTFRMGTDCQVLSPVSPLANFSSRD